MAGLEESLESPASVGGAFSPMARMQYRALGTMRWTMFRNTTRSTKGAMELGASTVSSVIFGLMGAAIAFGLGAGAFQAAAHQQWMILAGVMWVAFVLWQLVPITLASFQQQFDMGSLLRFPLSFGSFVVLHLVFGLVDLSTIMGSLCCLGIWIGITVAQPSMALGAAIALVAFAVFNILMVRAIFAWIDRWLAQRRTREMVTALFFIAILAVNFVNPAFHKNHKYTSETKSAAIRWLHSAETVQVWLPPGAAAQSIRGAGQGNAAEWVEFLALLGVYGAACGGALTTRLRAEFRGENFGEAPARSKEEKHTGKWLLDGSGPIAAVMEKELRTLFRAVPLLYGLGAPLVMVFLFAGLFHSGAAHAHLNLSWGLPVSVAYTMAGFTQLIYNNLGTEGAGIQLLFLSPTPIRKFILAKNLFHGALFLVDAVLVTILATLRAGTVPLLTLEITWAWIVFALPLNLAAGNLFSLIMPYRINLGRIGRQSGAQANALLAMLAQAVVLGIGVGILALCSVFSRPWLTIPILLGMTGVAIVVWTQVLARVDGIANSRREDLVSTLVRTE